MNSEIWDQAVVAYFKVLTQHLLWDTEENKENLEVE
jgi:hypothetical protein